MLGHERLFYFSTVNFPFIGNNIQAALAYGVYKSQLVHISELA